MISMKSPPRQYMERILTDNSKYIKGNVLNVGGGPRPYRHLNRNMINMDLFVNTEVDIKANIISDFPFKENTFDTVICTQVLEHVENPAKVIEEIHKVTKKNGILILSAPFLERYHPDPKDYWRFTEDGLTVLLRDKFKIILIEPFGGRAIWFACFIHLHRVFPRILVRLITKLAFYLDKYEKNKKIWTYGFFIVARKREYKSPD